MSHQSAGHPARTERDATRRKKRRKSKKDKYQIVMRSFMGRMYIQYDTVHFEQWVEMAGEGTTVFARFNLAAMLNRYAGVPENVLLDALECTQARWS